MINSCALFLESTATRFPHKVAVVDGDKSFTFEELRENAINLAQAISGEFTNQPVAVYLPKSAESIVAFAAILYSGNFYVPLDAAVPTSRMKTIAANLEPVVVITNLARERDAQECFPRSQVIVGENYLKRGAPSARVIDLVVQRVSRVINTDPAYCMYTSGSTGAPKGVTIPHQAVVDFIDWADERFRVVGGRNIGNQAPFHFDNSTLDVYLMLKGGATLHIIPESCFVFPVQLMAYLNTHAIDFIFWVPSVLSLVARLNLLEKAPLPALRQILFAGEVMPTAVLNYWKRFIPQATYVNLYGPTETTVDCLYYVVDREFRDDESLPIGNACRNSDVFILNEKDRLASESESGEICVRGSSLALGYWRDPERTAVSFTQNPLHDNFPERIYRTGDIARYNAFGEICFVGRKDSQIKHFGYRIELGEVELAASAVPDVQQACVVYNKRDQRITLFVVFKHPGVSISFLRRQLGGALPKYMLPADVIELDDLPLTANGKIDRALLTARLSD